MPDLTKDFLLATEGSDELRDAIGLVTSCSLGGIWLIGGFVYRNIASVLYGIDRPAVDLDFIVESISDDYTLPDGWTQINNHYGNPKLVRSDGLTVDLVPLNNVSSIIRRGLEPTIENFLTGTPLNIQSIVFDIKTSQVIGDIGSNAIIDRFVSVNDVEQLKICASHKGKTSNEVITEKAIALGFELRL